MKKKIVLISVLAVSSVVLFLLVPEKGRACFQERCFKVEIADTQVKRSLGLMFRESLPLDEGMLFVFEKEGAHSFWMKNTLIPLDIIWISKEKEIVFIKENARPCFEEPCSKINPRVDALYVLEVNAGAAGEMGLKEGQRMSFERGRF